ncbi:MAG: transcription antitermination factor NusB [Bacilli bacterium]|jgi:N utilization substance protein B|nr:transcription antitermination factor NusB [Bacilli bacterium]
MKRTITRVMAMMVLYHIEIMGSSNMDEIKAIAEKDLSFDEDFLSVLVNGVLDHQKEIDHIISRYLNNYTLDRLSYLDRNLIRIGTYELKYTNTPTSIVINEIVEISKEYSEIEGFSTSKFNNSILDRIAKGLADGT